MHMMFNFQVNQSLFYALASADMKPLVKALNATRPDYATRNGACSCATMTSSISAG